MKIAQEEKIINNFILPSLKAIDINQENTPKIKIFEGAEGITKAFDDYVLKHQSVINCGSYETAIKVVSYKQEARYFEAVSKRKIFYRMILEDTPLNREFAEMGKSIIHTKFLPEGTKTSADIVISGPLVVLISYDKKIATIIDDESISQAIKIYLDFMWERL